MKSSFDHIQIDIDYSHIEFYKKLLTFLGWSIIFESDHAIGYKSEGSGDVWFLKSEKKVPEIHDFTGVSHISFKVARKKDVDEATAYIKKLGVEPKFETPRHRPEFTFTPEETYYQVMFSSPDNVIFEIFYSGKKE